MIRLVPVTAELARAVTAHEGLGDLRHAPDWPHADTYDALRPLAEHARHVGPGTFLVAVDGVVVGDCGWFGPPDGSGEVEIGYGLAPSARGQGLGSAAVRLLLGWVAEQGATRVRAEVLPGNEASRRLLAGLGFDECGQESGHLVLLCDVAHLAGAGPAN